MVDTGSGSSPDVLAQQRAREIAEARRREARARFETPSWLGPARHGVEEQAPTIPRQVEPRHEDLVPPAPPRPDGIPDTAHYVEKAKPRVVAGTLLVVSLAAAVTALVYTITTQSVEAVVALVFSAFLAVICRGAMMSSGLAIVDLKGSMLKVQHAGHLDTFDLAGAGQLVELVGTPGRRDWRLRLETADGRIVELAEGQVDSGEMHRTVEYYRTLATARRRDRDRRHRS